MFVSRKHFHNRNIESSRAQAKSRKSSIQQNAAERIVHRVEWGDLYRSPKVVGTQKRHEALRRASCLYLAVTWQNAERRATDQATQMIDLKLRRSDSVNPEIPSGCRRAFSTHCLIPIAIPETRASRRRRSIKGFSYGATTFDLLAKGRVRVKVKMEMSAWTRVRLISDIRDSHSSLTCLATCQ